MKNYLIKNKEHWDKGYDVENTESWVFRFYGKILKYEFGMDGSKHNKLLDFGCGSGANLKFFKEKGFDVYGVDISKADINRCKQKMPDIKDNFKVINSKPESNIDYFGEKFDVIIGIQSLYYLSDSDLKTLLKSFDKMLNPGGIVYFTMMGREKSIIFFKNSKYVGDGLYRIDFDYPRTSCHDYYINMMNKTKVLKTFKIFNKKHLGFYMEKYREEEPETHHYIFVGQKK